MDRGIFVQSTPSRLMPSEILYSSVCARVPHELPIVTFPGGTHLQRCGRETTDDDEHHGDDEELEWSRLGQYHQNGASNHRKHANHERYHHPPSNAEVVLESAGQRKIAVGEKQVPAEINKTGGLGRQIG